MSSHLSPQFDVLGVRVSAVNLDLACRVIHGWISERAKTYVCVAPVATIIDCQRNPEYKDIINGSGMTTPDGMPLVWIGKRRGHRDMGRTYGPDLMQAFFEFSQDKGCRHYFYGGTQATLDKLIERIRRQFPKIQICGSFAPPFRKTVVTESRDIIGRINDAHPDVLWVGLGSPKQDFWMARNRAVLDVPVMIGVGAAFDFFAGTKPQAPLWMQKSGLEWFFRLCCEPKRLWRRYLLGNSLFIFLLMKDFFKRALGHGVK